MSCTLCESPSFRRNLCSSHYTRLRRHGDPMGGKHGTTKPGTLMKWIYDHVNYEGDDCLPWPFGKLLNGRGQIEIDGKSTLAHRVMCRKKRGDPPDESFHAAHSCGNGHLACINPNHLLWKTPVQNEADKRVHGTVVHGEANNKTKLTERQVLTIREMQGRTVDIAARYGVTKETINNIRAGRTWKHLA